MATFRLGTSGWQYDHWRGRFYPADLPKKRWFAHYARHFDTVEINNSFYRLPSEAAFRAWRAQAPPGFLYAVKYSRFGTHMKKLKDPETHVPNLMERAVLLGGHLGPVLVQLPPGWTCNADRLAAFLEKITPLARVTVEFRDPRWLCGEVYEVLRAFGAALCLHDLIPDHPEVLTARFTYLRFHGAGYDGAYALDLLERHAERIAAWLARGIDVYAYFNNDLGGHAVVDALRLRDLVEPHPVLAR